MSVTGKLGRIASVIVCNAIAGGFIWGRVSHWGYGMVEGIPAFYVVNPYRGCF